MCSSSSPRDAEFAILRFTLRPALLSCDGDDEVLTPRPLLLLVSASLPFFSFALNLPRRLVAVAEAPPFSLLFLYIDSGDR
jgi:hypothetical protein